MKSFNMINKCYSYFIIKGQYPLSCATNIFSVDETGDSWNIGDKKKYSDSRYDFAGWMTHKFEEKGDFSNEQFYFLMSVLSGKETGINLLKEKYGVNTGVAIVPTVEANNSMYIKIPSALLKFCYETKTIIDIDYYVADNKERIEFNSCCSYLLIRGCEDGKIADQLCGIGIKNVFLDYLGNSYNSINGNLKSLVVEYYSEKETNAEDVLHQTIECLSPKIDALKSIMDKYNLPVELQLSVQVVDQLTRPLISPSFKLIEFCNSLGIGFNVLINENHICDNCPDRKCL